MSKKKTSYLSFLHFIANGNRRKDVRTSGNSSYIQDHSRWRKTPVLVSKLPAFKTLVAFVVLTSFKYPLGVSIPGQTFMCSVILVPRAHDLSGLRQRSRALAGPDFLSMRRVLVSYYQPIRFAKFDGKSVNRGLPVLDKARALDLCRRPERSWALGTRMVLSLLKLPKWGAHGLTKSPCIPASGRPHLGHNIELIPA